MRQRYVTVLSRATLRTCRKARMASRSSAGSCGPPGWLGLARGDGEASVEARQEALDHGLHLGDGGGRGKAQFGHEAVLESTCDALHAALGLRRAGQDEANPQLGHRPCELVVRFDRPAPVLATTDCSPGARDERYLVELLAAELDDRNARRRERRIREARFPRRKHLADFDLAEAADERTLSRLVARYGRSTCFYEGRSFRKGRRGGLLRMRCSSWSLPTARDVRSRSLCRASIRTLGGPSVGSGA